MKANKKKLLSILTAFVMAFTVFGCTGWAFAEETTGDDPEVQLMDEGEPAVVDTEEPAEEPAGQPAQTDEQEEPAQTVELNKTTLTLSKERCFQRRSILASTRRGLSTTIGSLVPTP